MRRIDIDTWKRKEHFEHFMKYAYPHFNLSANVDITRYYSYIKEKKYPVFISLAYAVTRACNEVEEFRYRIQDDQVVVYDRVDAAVTVMGDDDVFNFCTLPYSQSYQTFLKTSTSLIEKAKKSTNIAEVDESEGDDVIYMTSIPWVSFTSVMHPIDMNPVDSIPRIAWGKFFQQGDKILLPLSIQGHHALMDGVHAGKYYQAIQGLLDAPENYLE